MSSFDKFREKLSDEGLELRKQWEVPRAQYTLAHYLIFGGAIRVHNEVLVQHWPVGYSCYFPSPSDKIDDDVSIILSGKVDA